MNKKLFSRLTSFVLCVMLVFTVMPAGISFASQTAEYEFVLTTDKYSVKAGDTVIITTTINGDIKDILSVEYRVKFDNTAFSVNTTDTGGRPPKYTNTFESEWYNYVQQTVNGYGYGLAAISAPKPGQYVENGSAYMSMVYADTINGYTLDSGAPDYGKTSVVASKVIFTAIKDVDNVAAAFELDANSLVLETQLLGQNKVSRTTSAVQIPNIDMAAVENVNTLITAIPDTVTYADKAKVEAARTAYNSLNDAEKALVTNADKLTVAEAALAAIQDNIDAVEAKISAIGTVEFTTASKALIDDARSAYDALNDDAEKAAVENYSTLTDAEQTYETLKAEAEAQAANKAAAEAVDAKIEAIGDVQYTAASKALIDDASAAYDVLTSAQQVLVTKKDTLDAAIAAYKALDDEVADAEAKFKAFEDRTVTIEYANDINDLNKAWNVLDSDQLAALDAKLGYSSTEKLADYVAAYNASVARVNNVCVLIDAIGTVTLESGEAIETAEAAYEDLLDVEQTYITNYSTLTKARADYNTLLTYKAAADEVIADIEALIAPEDVTKDNVETVAQKAAAARTSYENLPDRTMVSDASIEKLEAVEAACQTVKDDLAAAKEVDDLIAAIGTVSLGSIDKIEAAEEAYAGLTDTQQTYVTKLDILEAARNTYDALKAEQDAIDAVKDLITAIGGVDNVTLGSLADIEAAEAAYKALDDTLKSRVENYNDLVAARAKYEELLASKGKVDAVIAQIDAIGEVTLGSLAKIQAAEAGYSALSDEEKDSVTNYQTLLDARATYDELQAAADKEEADRAAAEGVDNLISELGEITLESEADITAARNAYEGLTDDQKALVENLAVLQAAEVVLEQLKVDKAEVDAVIAIINEIGEVVYPDSLDLINDAQTAYDALRDDLKDDVINYGVLTAAQQTYAALEKDYNDIQAVIALIDAIGDVEYTVEVKERIDAADTAYLALREELRAEVTNADVLEAAKADYEAHKPTYNATEEPVAEYGDVYVIVFNNIPEGRKVTLNGIEAQVVTEGEDVYYVVLSADELNPAEVLVEEGTSESFLMGDTDNNGTVTATDALAANQKSANIEVRYYTEDAMTYVRTDINGSGTITAYDALMIARIAAGKDVVTNFVAGK